MSGEYSGEYQVIRVPVQVSRSNVIEEDIFRGFEPPQSNEEKKICYPVTFTTQIGGSFRRTSLDDRLCSVASRHKPIRFDDVEVTVNGQLIKPQMAWIDLDNDVYEGSRTTSPIPITFLSFISQDRMSAATGMFEVLESSKDILAWPSRKVTPANRHLQGTVQPEVELTLKDYTSITPEPMVQRIKGRLDCLTEKLYSEYNSHWSVLQSHQNFVAGGRERDGAFRTTVKTGTKFDFLRTKKSQISAELKRTEKANDKVEDVTVRGLLIGLLPASTNDGSQTEDGIET